MVQRPPGVLACAENPAGTQMSTSLSRIENPGGITPTIVNRFPSRRMPRLITLASPREASLPEPIADEHDALGLRLIVGRGQYSTDRGIDTEDREQRGVDDLLRQLLRLSVTGVGRAKRHADDRHVGERPIHLAPMEVIPRRNDVVLSVARKIVLPDYRESIGVPVGQPLNEQRIDDGEDGGVGTDPDRQGGNGDGRECWRAISSRPPCLRSWNVCETCGYSLRSETMDRPTLRAVPDRQSPPAPPARGGLPTAAKLAGSVGVTANNCARRNAC